MKKRMTRDLFKNNARYQTKDWPKKASFWKFHGLMPAKVYKKKKKSRIRDLCIYIPLGLRRRSSASF
jgi:hypothetical protein